jgi:RNA polymerase sigma-70 factor, ECF subfamily
VTAHDMTFTDAGRLLAGAEAAASTLAMDEDEFRAFYDRTARLLWAYLSRVTGDPSAADDLLQESYYRLLRAGVRFESEAHGRHYLFRVATNLVRDRHRRAGPPEEPLDEGAVAGGVHQAEQFERRHHLRQALERMKPRERAMLWLAYAEGSSHKEIADVMGVRASGVRVLLFRARRKLAALLSASGHAGDGRSGHGD